MTVTGTSNGNTVVVGKDSDSDTTVMEMDSAEL